MCSVIGVYLEQPGSKDLETVEKVFHESSIRGLHATGASWVYENRIHTLISATPAGKFIEAHPLEKMINEDGNLYLIGHCRYSTSDLNYNQPLWDEGLAIVHNGVVSQEMPEKWKDLYGYDCKTRNDSELILHTLKANKSPLEEFKDSSMAVIELYKEKTLRFYRNGKRPIYFTSLINGVIITSTKDIASRAGLSHSTESMMNQYVTLSNSTLHMKAIQIENAKDLQHVQ